MKRGIICFVAVAFMAITLGMNIGQSAAEIDLYIQSDKYKAQEAAHFAKWEAQR